MINLRKKSILYFFCLIITISFASEAKSQNVDIAPFVKFYKSNPLDSYSVVSLDNHLFVIRKRAGLPVIIDPDVLSWSDDQIITVKKNDGETEVYVWSRIREYLLAQKYIRPIKGTTVILAGQLIRNERAGGRLEFVFRDNVTNGEIFLSVQSGSVEIPENQAFLIFGEHLFSDNSPGGGRGAHIKILQAVPVP